MSVAVIGIGNIGSRLTRRLAAHGVPVTVAASSLDKAEEFAAAAGDNVTAASVEDAIDNNDMVVFATMFASTKELLAQHKDRLAGKIVIDPSNNIAFNAAGEASSLNPEGVSAGMQLSGMLGETTRYVKTFGTMSAAQLEQDKTAQGEPVVMFYATDDEAAGQRVADELIRPAGWTPVRAGGVDVTGRIEVFGDLHPFGGLQDRLLSEAEARDLLAR